jgi:hypothetical protein
LELPYHWQIAGILPKMARFGHYKMLALSMLILAIFMMLIPDHQQFRLFVLPLWASIKPLATISAKR